MMKRVSCRQCAIARLAIFAMLATFVAAVDAEVPEGGYHFFTNVFGVVHDMVYEDMSFGKYQRQSDIAAIQSLIDERGWTTGQVVEALSYLVTNGVPAGTKRWTGPVRNKLVFDRSLSRLPVFGGTNALPAIEYVIDRRNPLVSKYAYSEYATVLGFGHSAINQYVGKLISPSNTNHLEAWHSFYRIRNVFERGPRSAVETNRMVYLLVRLSEECPYEWSTWNFDRNMCALLPAYTTSSNRLCYINGISGDMPLSVSNYFSNARNQLLSFPPGTMQMLPTNQFYNVED